MGVHVPRIIEEECVGCNLCALVCPVENCITMKEVDTGDAPMSWNDRVRQSSATLSLPSPSGDCRATPPGKGFVGARHAVLGAILAAAAHSAAVRSTLQVIAVRCLIRFPRPAISAQYTTKLTPNPTNHA